MVRLGHQGLLGHLELAAALGLPAHLDQAVLRSFWLLNPAKTASLARLVPVDRRGQLAVRGLLACRACAAVLEMMAWMVTWGLLVRLALLGLLDRQARLAHKGHWVQRSFSKRKRETRAGRDRQARQGRRVLQVQAGADLAAQRS